MRLVGLSDATNNEYLLHYYLFIINNLHLTHDHDDEIGDFLVV